MADSVRQHVGSIQRELRSGDVLPARAREMLMTLTSLYGNCLTEATKTEQAYKTVLVTCLDSEKKANRATIRAELSVEYGDWQAARNTVTLVTELIRSLKVLLKSIEEEMRLAS